VNVPAPRLQRIVVQNDLSVNSKLFGFADDSCHQALAAKSFFVLRSRGPRRRVLVRDVSERTAKRRSNIPAGPCAQINRRKQNECLLSRPNM
jgi:hypothetical protein